MFFAILNIFANIIISIGVKYVTGMRTYISMCSVCIIYVFVYVNMVKFIYVYFLKCTKHYNTEYKVLICIFFYL